MRYIQTNLSQLLLWVRESGQITVGWSLALIPAGIIIVFSGLKTNSHILTPDIFVGSIFITGLIVIERKLRRAIPPKKISKIRQLISLCFTLTLILQMAVLMFSTNQETVAFAVTCIFFGSLFMISLHQETRQLVRIFFIDQVAENTRISNLEKNHQDEILRIQNENRYALDELCKFAEISVKKIKIELSNKCQQNTNEMQQTHQSITSGIAEEIKIEKENVVKLKSELDEIFNRQNEYEKSIHNFQKVNATLLKDKLRLVNELEQVRKKLSAEGRIIDETDCREMSPKFAAEVLGISSDKYSPEDITRSYRQLALRVHPDHGGNAIFFRMIKHAKETLVQ
jgi:hypothetical protein